MTNNTLGTKEITPWTENLQSTLRSGNFNDLYLKAGFEDVYLEEIYGQEPEYEVAINEEAANGSLAEQVKEATPYIVQFCVNEEAELSEILPSFDPQGSLKMIYYFSKKNIVNHPLSIEEIKTSLEYRV